MMKQLPGKKLEYFERPFLEMRNSSFWRDLGSWSCIADRASRRPPKSCRR